MEVNSVEGKVVYKIWLEIEKVSDVDLPSESYEDVLPTPICLDEFESEKEAINYVECISGQSVESSNGAVEEVEQDKHNQD